VKCSRRERDEEKIGTVADLEIVAKSHVSITANIVSYFIMLIDRAKYSDKYD